MHKGLFRVCFSPNGRWLACTGLSGTHLIDAVNYAIVATLKSDNFYTFAVDFSPDSSVLATGGADGVIKIWDVETSSLIRQCNGHADHIYSVEFSPDGHRLLSCAKDRSVRIWDPLSTECLLTLMEHNGWVFRARWSPDGTTVASCSEDRNVILRHSVPGTSANSEAHSGPRWSPSSD